MCFFTTSNYSEKVDKNPFVLLKKYDLSWKFICEKRINVPNEDALTELHFIGAASKSMVFLNKLEKMIFRKLKHGG